MKYIAVLVAIFTVSGCFERSNSDVCNYEDEVSLFLCETSKYDPKIPNRDVSRAFYVSRELQERAVPNIIEALSESMENSGAIALGGSDHEETQRVILKAIENIKEKEITLEKVQVVYFGRRELIASVESGFKELGAEYQFVRY